MPRKFRHDRECDAEDHGAAILSAAVLSVAGLVLIIVLIVLVVNHSRILSKARTALETLNRNVSLIMARFQIISPSTSGSPARHNSSLLETSV